MTNYKLVLEYESEEIAENEEEAMKNFFENMAVENLDPATWIEEHMKVITLCGNCGREATQEVREGFNRCDRCANL